ncbi:MAG: DNA replication/repair protein RecF [Puniceicoccales bacterium]
MKILSCNLENFRNIESARLRFEGDRIFFVGLNGQGKSNLLEALGLLQAVRSFRTSDLRHLIRKEQPAARLYFELETEAPDNETVLLQLKRTGGREVILNSERCPSLGDFLARFPTVVLATDDVQVVRGSPSLRRRMMDLHFATSRKGYYEILRDFTRGLAARNRLLKNHASMDQIRAHDYPLSEAGALLNRYRREGTEILSPQFTEVFRKISEGKDDPGVRLRSSFTGETAENLRQNWEEGLERDRLLGSTQIGPHRDDWIFSTNTGTARDYASDGQQRNLAIALKLTLFRDLASRSTETPVLLADDILGELDSRRRKAFWESLPTNCQVFSTGTEFIPERHPGEWEVFTVDSGTFVRDNP